MTDKQIVEGQAQGRCLFKCNWLGRLVEPMGNKGARKITDKCAVGTLIVPFVSMAFDSATPVAETPLPRMERLKTYVAEWLDLQPSDAFDTKLVGRFHEYQADK